jgi:hypothetical protein
MIVNIAKIQLYIKINSTILICLVLIEIDS